MVELQRSQCALTGQWKPKGFPQRPSHMSFLMRCSSSRVSHNVANKIGGGSTYLTGFGSVYHSRRDCGKLKAAKTVGKFLPCMECGYDKPSMFFEDRVPQPVKRK